MHSLVRWPPAPVAFFCIITVAFLDPGSAGDAQTIPNSTNALPYASAAVDVDTIFSQFVECNRQRESLLQRYSAVQRYEVKNTKGQNLAEQMVVMDYQSPGTMTLHVLTSKGSVLMRGALERLMKGEIRAATPRGRQESDIDPVNYTLNLVGDELVKTHECWVLGMVPRRKSEYLIQGKLWVTKADLGTVKIIGRPAKSPSFWIKHVDFIREYQHIGEFWLPRRDEIIADIRILGRRVLTIDYTDYKINAGPDMLELGRRSPAPPAAQYHGRALPFKQRDKVEGARAS
jgi:hypothetical protein